MSGEDGALDLTEFIHPILRPVAALYDEHDMVMASWFLGKARCSADA